MGTTLATIEAVVGSLGRGYAASPVQLGGVILTGVEVPDRLRVGGRQMLTVHRIAGGGKVIDFMGNDPDRLELSGRFMGPDAQGKAQSIERMRSAGSPVPFSGAGLSSLVWVAEFAYDYQARGAICSYRLILERVDVPPSGASQDGTGLSVLLGQDVSGALSGVTGAIAALSTGVFSLTGQVGTVVGQVTPIANFIGQGGIMASVGNQLSKIGALAQTGLDLSTTPGSVASIGAGLAQAGAGLNAAIAGAGANIETISPNNAASLSALVQNAGVLNAAVDAGGLINQATARTAALNNSPYVGPIVSG